MLNAEFLFVKYRLYIFFSSLNKWSKVNTPKIISAPKNIITKKMTLLKYDQYYWHIIIGKLETKTFNILLNVFACVITTRFFKVWTFATRGSLTCEMMIPIIIAVKSIVFWFVFGTKMNSEVSLLKNTSADPYVPLSWVNL